MSGGGETRDIFKPSGTPQPQVSAGLSMLESVVLKSGKKERPHSSSNPLKCCFCVIDPQTNSVNPEERTPAHMLQGRS